MSYVNTIWWSENDSATKIVHVSKLKPPAVPPPVFWPNQVQTMIQNQNCSVSQLKISGCPRTLAVPGHSSFQLGFYRVNFVFGSRHLILVQVFTASISFLAPGTLFLSWHLILVGPTNLLCRAPTASTTLLPTPFPTVQTRKRYRGPLIAT